jgi:predicted nucleic acid-binding protein
LRYFDTGASRDDEGDKLDFEGFLSPLVLERYCQYLHEHRKQADGEMRDADNWQKGIPLNVYMKSMWRHFMSLWKQHRGYDDPGSLEDALCAILFNASGYLHETLARDRRS